MRASTSGRRCLNDIHVEHAKGLSLLVHIPKWLMAALALLGSLDSKMKCLSNMFDPQRHLHNSGKLENLMFLE